MADEINDEEFYNVELKKAVAFAGRQLRPTQKHTIRGAVVRQLREMDADAVGEVSSLKK